MGLSYYWVDYKGHRKGCEWLKVYGMNSIVAYMLANVINFRCIAESLFYGLQPYIGGFYSFLLMLAQAGIIYFLLWVLYQKRIFLKV